MAWSFVGSTSGAGTSTGYTISLSGTLTGGSNSSPSAGDLVVVFSGFGNTASSAPAVSGNTSGAYQGATAAQHVNDAWDTEFRSFYQVMGSTPDTTLTVTRATNTAYGGATTVMVWRGVNTVTPFIGAATPASAGNTSLINPPAYNPAVTNALIIAGGAGTQSTTGAAFTGFTGMANFITRKGDGSTSDIDVAMASYAYAGVSYDPPVVSGGTGGNASSSWAGVTIAFRMAEDHPATGTLTGQGSTVVGSAARASASVTHATTGVLTGTSSTLVGSANRTRVMTTTGTLTGPGSTLAGSADRQDAPASVEHTTSGVLVGPGSLIVGSASNYTVHGSSAVLVGAGSAVVGSAARYRAMASTGALTGAGAVLAGDAARSGAPAVHETSGTLTGPGSVLGGSASGTSSAPQRVFGGDVTPWQRQIWKRIEDEPQADEIIKVIEAVADQIVPDTLSQQVEAAKQVRLTLENMGIAYKQAYQEIYLALLAERQQEQEDAQIAAVMAALL